MEKSKRTVEVDEIIQSDVRRGEGTKSVKCVKDGALEAQNTTKTNGTEKKDQERTQIKKRLFLEFYERSFGAITWTCKKIETDRETFHRWRKNDPAFAKAVAELDRLELSNAEEQLKAGINSGDGAQIRFYLSRRHPKYMLRATDDTTEVGETLEDIFDEAEGKIEPKHGHSECENGQN